MLIINQRRSNLVLNATVYIGHQLYTAPTLGELLLQLIKDKVSDQPAEVYTQGQTAPTYHQSFYKLMGR